MNMLKVSISRRAFTVIELLVVIALIVILVLIAVPSFQGMIGSSEEAMAQTQLQTALASGRNAAIASNGKGDGAAVFVYDTNCNGHGRLTVVPCVKAGEIVDIGANGKDVTREVFAPVATGVSTVLPRHWMVRGFVPAGLTNADWYANKLSTGSQWLFPETNFFDYNSVGSTDAYNRSTFMVRFEGGTGRMKASPGKPVLVILPRSSGNNRGVTGAVDRADFAEDLGQFVQRVLHTPGYTKTEHRILIGRESTDMVLVAPVTVLALYNEDRLAEAFGVSTDRQTACLYKCSPTRSDIANNDFSKLLPEYVAMNISEDKIAQWIEADTNMDGKVDAAGGRDEPQARLYSIERPTGRLHAMEVQP